MEKIERDNSGNGVHVPRDSSLRRNRFGGQVRERSSDSGGGRSKSVGPRRRVDPALGANSFAA
eukprot:6168913-Alexandrium_andersonii.AAC.1